MSRLRAVAWYPLAVLPLGAAVLYAKLQLMRHEGYLIVARAAGGGLTWLDPLTFFPVDPPSGVRSGKRRVGEEGRFSGSPLH